MKKRADTTPLATALSAPDGSSDTADVMKSHKRSKALSKMDQHSAPKVGEGSSRKGKDGKDLILSETQR